MVWDEIRRGAQSMLDEGQKVPRWARLKAQVKGLETELGDRIYDLGTRTLDLHRRNELHHYELDEMFVEIQNLQRELREVQDEVDELMSGWRIPGAEPAVRETCPDCRKPVKPDDRFCRSCGASLKGA